MRHDSNLVLEKGGRCQEEGATSGLRRNLHLNATGVATNDGVVERECESSMGDELQQLADSRHEAEENGSKGGDEAPTEDVGPDTPRPLYREDRSENMECDHALSEDEDEGAALDMSEVENGDTVVEESYTGKRDGHHGRRNLEDLFAMYEHDGEWEDEDDDEDWEPRQMQLEWFCTNCTMPNSDDSLHCGYCGEHKKSGILNAGFVAPADLQLEVPDESQTESEKESEGTCHVSQSDQSPLSLLSISSSTSPGRFTAIGYDERMLLHSEVVMKLHPHPERPDRLRSIIRGLAAAGLFQRCHAISAREASRAELEIVHTKEHVDAVESTSRAGFSYFTSDTYANRNSALAARLAAGICADLATLIMKGQAQNGVALVRPPGHHAEQSTIMGFCLHNNAAIAAKAALAAGARKVLILDWDVHHGNGTQEIFEHDPFVLYISLHRHENGAFYPGTGAASEVGSGEGEGFSVNIPWVCGGIGDRDYIFAFQHVVLPIATQFMADMIIISAGFDAAQGDPLGGCEVTPRGYAQMAHMLTSLAQGRVLVVLEGGYNLRSISSSVAAVVKVLLGEIPEPLPDSMPTKAGLATMLEVSSVQARYWHIAAANAGQIDGDERPASISPAKELLIQPSVLRDEGLLD